MNVWEEKDLTPVVAIARHCLDCSQSMSERKDCVVTSCALWPFRDGKSHTGRPPVSDEVRAARKITMDKINQRRKAEKSTIETMGKSAS
jgi:hypothetical protein